MALPRGAWSAVCDCGALFCVFLSFFVCLLAQSNMIITPGCVNFEIPGEKNDYTHLLYFMDLSR